MRFDLADLSPRRSAKFALAALIAAGLIALAPFTARTWSSKPGSAKNGAVQQTPKAEPLGQLLITIRPTGFDPPEITHAKGEILLSVDNRSGLQAVDLRLESEQGNRLNTKRVPRENLDWRELVNLNPGTYLLKEASHPNWVCRIRITSK
jgi:hypothetical protein